MKLFNNHSDLRGLPRFAARIHWATGLSLTTPFTEGYPGANDKASLPGRHQEQAPNSVALLAPLRSVQLISSVSNRTLMIPPLKLPHKENK